MRMRVPAAVVFLILGSAHPAFGEVAYSRYKYGTWYSSPGCCNTIYTQDYDCQGRVLPSPYNPNGEGCYNTRSGDYIYGTCGGGCVMPSCGGMPTKLCVNEQANIGCGNCDVFLEPLAGSPPSNCTSRADPACAGRWGCGDILGNSCYTLPYDGDGDLASGYLCDKRTPQRIASGCQPPDLTCPAVGSFRAENREGRQRSHHPVCLRRPEHRGRV